MAAKPRTPLRIQRGLPVNDQQTKARGQIQHGANARQLPLVECTRFIGGDIKDVGDMF